MHRVGGRFVKRPYSAALLSIVHAGADALRRPERDILWTRKTGRAAKQRKHFKRSERCSFLP
jgi:hypothetical protein